MDQVDKDTRIYRIIKKAMVLQNGGRSREGNFHHFQMPYEDRQAWRRNLGMFPSHFLFRLEKLLGKVIKELRTDDFPTNVDLHLNDFLAEDIAHFIQRFPGYSEREIMERLGMPARGFPPWSFLSERFSDLYKKEEEGVERFFSAFTNAQDPPFTKGGKK